MVTFSFDKQMIPVMTAKVIILFHISALKHFPDFDSLIASCQVLSVRQSDQFKVLLFVFSAHLHFAGCS